MIAYFLGGSRDLTKQAIPHAERWLTFLRPSKFDNQGVEEEHYVFVTEIMRSLEAASRPGKEERTYVYALSHVTSKGRIVEAA